MLGLLLTCSRFPVRGDYTKPKSQVQIISVFTNENNPITCYGGRMDSATLPTQTRRRFFGEILRQPAGGEKVTALVNCSSLSSL